MVGTGNDERFLVSEQSVRPSVIVLPRPAGTFEDGHRQLRLSDQFESGACSDVVGDLPGEGQGVADRLTVGGGPVGREGEPQGKPPGTPGQLGRVVRGTPFDGLSEGVEVLRVLGVRPASGLRVTVDECAGIVRGRRAT